MDQNPNMQEGFSLADLFYIIKNGLRPIIISVVFFGILAGIYAYSIAQEEYRSNVDIYITPITESQTSSSDYTVARYLIMTVAEYFESNSVIDKVILDLNLDESKESFKSKLTVTASTDSYRINVAYQDINPVNTKLIVNYLVEVGINNQMTDNPERFLPDTIELVGILSTDNGTYASPNKPLLVIIGLMVGGIIGLGIAFGKELLNNSFKTKEQLEAAFDIQVLGIIPEFEIKEDF